MPLGAEGSSLVVASLHLDTQAAALGPASCCADEVDGLLGVRRAQDHDATLSIKTEFMQHWDGLLTDSDVRPLPAPPLWLLPSNIEIMNAG